MEQVQVLDQALERALALEQGPVRELGPVPVPVPE